MNFPVRRIPIYTFAGEKEICEKKGLEEKGGVFMGKTYLIIQLSGFDFMF